MRLTAKLAGAGLITTGALALALGGAGHTIANAQSVVEIDMIGNQFTPSDITIAAGDTVWWLNAEDADGGTGAVHDLLNGDDNTPISSELLAPGDALSFEFDTPGVYHIICDLHPGMASTITVE